MAENPDQKPMNSISRIGRPIPRVAGYPWPIFEVVIEGCSIDSIDEYVVGKNFLCFDDNVLFAWGISRLCDLF